MTTKEAGPVTPEQSRAGRGLLDWSQTQLAAEAGLSESTVRNFEKGERAKSTRAPSAEAIGAITAALKAAGIELIPENGGGAGVRLAKRQKPKGRR